MKEDLANSPKHYTAHPSGVECIQITRHMSFNLGNVVKYLWRSDLKNAPIQDLEKALWYLQDEIALRKRQAEDANVRSLLNLDAADHYAGE